ncbi:hypothetical protein CFP56_017918 [Quercus suber]|uniref:Uncharacterized protein n=1 Tax=Quercus suber TaxID=58331 RepID=A0AAW0KME9_QUESU
MNDLACFSSTFKRSNEDASIGKDIAAIMTSTAVQNEIFETFLRKRNHLHSCQILKVLVDIHCLGEVVFHELLITVN